MKTTQGYTTIDNVIRELIQNEGRTTLHRYLKYLSYIVKAYRHFQINLSKEIKTDMLRLDNKRAARYPDDLIRFTKIGLVFKDRVQVFIPDDTIALHFEKKGAVYQPNQAWVTPEELSYGFENYLTDTGQRSTVYVTAKGYNSIGYYKMNDACREIQFSADVDKCSVYVEYIANANAPCNKTYVPVVAIDMMQEAIKYYDLKYKYGENDGRTRAQWLAWDNSIMTYKGNTSDLTESGIRNILFRHTHRFFKI
jgi:hypothetical protein